MNIKETVLFILESVLFTFSIFGSWIMEQCLGIDHIIEVSVQCCIIAFYLIRLWGSEELKERPYDKRIFLMSLVPVFLTVALSGFKIQKDFSLTMIPLYLITATCEELHFRVNGCHLFREDGALSYFDCTVLISVFAVCQMFTFIAEGIPISVLSVLESISTGILLLGLYLRTGNTKLVIIIHTLLLITENLVFKSIIPIIELINVCFSSVLGILFIKKANLI